jgi:carbonic anhydrase/acetyltransferase-like protein (isoleucine patch superfamily)
MVEVTMAYRGVAPRLGNDVFVAPTARIIGDVEIGADSSVWFGCTVRADVNFIRIGARTNIQDGCVIHVDSKHHPTIVGDNVTIGHMALIHACTIESGAFVGMNATIMDGAVVASGAMVAAGALVTPGKRVPNGEVWAGQPARYHRSLTDQERADLLDTVDRYVALARSYRQDTVRTTEFR